MSVPHLSRPLLARLYSDLAELLDSPYPGVAVFTDDADIRKLCLVLTPPSGPWKDLSLHFDVELPDNWVCPLILLDIVAWSKRLVSQACRPSKNPVQCDGYSASQFVWRVYLL